MRLQNKISQEDKNMRSFKENRIASFAAVSRKGVEPISLTEANSRIFLRAFSYKAIALSRKIANKSIENLLSVRCKQFTDINQ